MNRYSDALTNSAIPLSENARMVRNLFEETVRNEGNPLISLEDVSAEALALIDAVDVPQVVACGTNVVRRTMGLGASA